jgi:type I restriction enzyme S subunit
MQRASRRRRCSPPPEQEQIVKYLDEKTSQIDGLISVTEKKIELLKQKRTSLINEVVTKGLNPHVELKNSGVEWIGEIPKHWVVSKFKYVSEIVTGNTPSKTDGGEYYSENDDEGFLWVKPTSLNLGYVNHSEEKLTELGKEQTRVIPKDSIMICCIGNTIGKYGMSGQELSTNQQINSVIPNQIKVKPWFYFYYIDVFTRDLLNRSNFVTLPILTKSDLENVEMILPPIEEQEKIVEYIDTHITKIDKLVSIEQRRIETLKEYRQSLISEVVTGKFKVTTN